MRKTTLFCSLMAMLLLLLCPALPACAAKYEDSSPDDFITKRFDVTAVFDTAHRASITEDISVTFVKSHHGIIRDIPLATDHSYAIENVKVPGYNYNTSTDDDFLRIKVGDSAKSLTGDYVYRIQYDLVYYADDSRENDYLAQNMLPTGWSTSIRKSKLTLTMPKPIDWSRAEIYYGEYGSSDKDWTTAFKDKIDGNSLILTGKNLPLHYGLTVRDTALPEGYWSDVISYAEANIFLFSIIAFLFTVSIILPVILWFIYGHDPAVVETVEFYPPEDMTPAEVGYALDGLIDDSDMMTTILYGAQKGYIKIHETKKKKLEATKGFPVKKAEPPFVAEFIQGLFDNRKTVTLSKMPRSFRETLDKTKNTMSDTYKNSHGYVFTLESIAARWGCMILLAAVELLYGLLIGNDMVYAFFVPAAIQLFAMSMINFGYDKKEEKGVNYKLFLGIIVYLAGFALSVYMISWDMPSYLTWMAAISQLTTPFFVMIMQRRDPDSARLLGKLRGFRRFIRVAEYEKLVALSDEDPEYFYKVLPYAAVFGMETNWSKKFTKIKIPQPGWYDSYNDAPFVYTAAWSNMLIHSCVTEAVPPPPVSSSSGGGYSGGSSGGGFSGGGGGGGGGGAW